MTDDRATPPPSLRRRTRCRRLALLAAHLHTGPVREQGKLRAVCSALYSRPEPRWPLWPSGGKGGPAHSPGAPSSPPPPCLFPWIHAIHSRFQESESRFGQEEGLALEWLGHKASQREAEASPARSLKGPKRRVPGCSKARAVCPIGPLCVPAAALWSRTPIHTGWLVRKAGCQQRSDAPAL